MSQVLRDYQLEMLERLHQAWEKNQSVMVQMPTGTGKTCLMAEVIRSEECRVKSEELSEQREPSSLLVWPSRDDNRCKQLEQREPSSLLVWPSRDDNRCKQSVLVVAHRIELIEQISQTLDRFGIEHGLIVSGKSVDETKQVQVASIQTLTRRIRTTDSDFNTKDHELDTDFSLIIIDEAHHAVAETYRMLWERWPKARFLGLTATPCRLNGAPFTDLFDTLLQSWSIREFIQKGWLSDLDYVSVRSDSIAVRKVASLNKRGADGDYQTKQAALVLDTEESIEHLYRSYEEFADGKKGIVYAINRDHARHIAEYYSERGLRCAVIDSKTPAQVRQRMVEEYRNNVNRPSYGPDGREYRGIDILVNVDIFSEGFDVPEVEFIQLARPTLSLSKYLQQVGRGMRVAKGKSEVVILDQVGLYLMFSLPTSDRNWQGTFLGRISGKGRVLNNDREPTNNRLSENGGEKWLVNEQMFRIKSVVGGKNQERNLQSSVAYENSELQYALVAKDFNSPAMEFCEEMAGKLKETLRTNRKVMVQVPPFVEKAQFVISLMCKEQVWNKERMRMEPPKTLVVVKRDSLTDLVEQEFRKNGLLDVGYPNNYYARMKDRQLVVCHEQFLYHIDFVLFYTPSLIVFWDGNSAEPRACWNTLHFWPKAKTIGLSLAPCDSISTPEFRLFDRVEPSQSLKEYIGQGLLKDVEYVSVPHAGLTGALLGILKPRKHPEDYVPWELHNRLTSLECIASLFKAYKDYADGKRGIVYALNDLHARGIAEYYSRHGVAAKVLYDDCPSKPRFPMGDFCSGDLKVLVDVHGGSVDYPLPEVQFVQLAYPTQLLSEYLSMVEARMRVTTDFTEGERIEDSDNKLLVIDHVKMGETFGLPTDERDWQRLFAERRVESEREPEKPKNKKPGRNSVANGQMTAATKWQQRKERLLSASPVQSDHPDETVKV